MAAATEVGSGMTGPGRATKSAGALILLALLAVSAPAATFYVSLAGLGGEADYTQRFQMWADDIDGSLKKAGGESTVTRIHSPTREQIRARFAELAKQAKPADSLVLIMIGHGSYDGLDYKFNIQGAD